MSTALVNLSGGIDSAYVLWKAAEDDDIKSIVVHHCNIINGEKRSVVENIATKQIISWISSKTDKKIKYIETSFDYLSVGYIIRDIEIIAFMNAAILRSQRYSIDTILVSANSSDESNDLGEPSVVRRRSILDAIGPSGNDSSRLRFPMLELSKKEIIKELPKGLLELTWYCRRPIGLDISGNATDPLSDSCVSWKTCHYCKTCRQVDEACRALGMLVRTTHHSLKDGIIK